jgi:PTH1 family peptidyl-tRNA hydrolase
MKIIFAQGNPGSQFARTRHNTGFMVLDQLAATEGGKWHAETKFRAEIAEIQLEGEKILLVKPGSFYNETASWPEA